MGFESDDGLDSLSPRPPDQSDRRRRGDRAPGGRERFAAFQWHYDVFDLPAGATRVLGNAFNPNQAYVVDDRHIGFQCHVEMTQDLVETWCRTGAAELPARSDGPLQSRDDILGAAPARVAELNRVADSIYDRWAVHLPA